MSWLVGNTIGWLVYCYVADSLPGVSSASQSHKGFTGTARRKRQRSIHSLVQPACNAAILVLFRCAPPLLMIIFRYLLDIYCEKRPFTASERLFIKKTFQHGLVNTYPMPILSYLTAILLKTKVSCYLIDVVDAHTHGFKPLTRLKKFCEHGFRFRRRALLLSIMCFDLALNNHQRKSDAQWEFVTLPAPNLHYDDSATNPLSKLSPPTINSFANFETICMPSNSVYSLCTADRYSSLPEFCYHRSETSLLEQALSPSLEWLSGEMEDHNFTIMGASRTTHRELEMICHISAAESEPSAPTIATKSGKNQDNPASTHRGIEAESGQRFVETFSICVKCFLYHSPADSCNCTYGCSDASRDGEANSMMAYVQAITDEDEPSRRRNFWTDKSKIASSHFNNVFRAAWPKGCWVLLIASCWYLWSKGYLQILLVGCELLCEFLLHINIGVLTTTFRQNLTNALFGEILEKGRPGKETEGFSDKHFGFDDSSRRWEETPIAAEGVYENDLPSAGFVPQMDSQFAPDPRQWLGYVPGNLAITQTTAGGDNSTTRAHVGGLTSSSTGAKTEANQRSYRSSKRKSLSSRKGKKKGAESDDEADENEDPNHSHHGEEPTSLFACPFWKARRGRNQECYDYVLQGIPALKQHLSRVHKAPDWYCFECHVDLLDEGRYQAHFRANQCIEATRDGPDLMRPDMLKHIKTKTPGRKPRDIWRDIYSTLFPNLPVPDNPYKTEEDPECVQHMSNLWSMLNPQTRQLVLADVSSRKEQMTESMQKTERVLAEALQSFDAASHTEEFITDVEQTTGQNPVPQNFDSPYDIVSNEIGGESLPGLVAVGSGISEGLDGFEADLLASEMEDLHALFPSPSDQDLERPILSYSS